MFLIIVMESVSELESGQCAFVSTQTDKQSTCVIASAVFHSSQFLFSSQIEEGVTFMKH